MSSVFQELLALQHLHWGSSTLYCLSITASFLAEMIIQPENNNATSSLQKYILGGTNRNIRGLLSFKLHIPFTNPCCLSVVTLVSILLFTVQIEVFSSCRIQLFGYSLEKRMLRWISSMSINTLWKGGKKTEPTSTDAQWWDQRQWAQTKTQEVPEHQEALLYCNGDWTWAQVAQTGCGVSLLGDTQKPSGDGLYLGWTMMASDVPANLNLSVKATRRTAGVGMTVNLLPEYDWLRIWMWKTIKAKETKNSRYKKKNK